MQKLIHLAMRQDKFDTDRIRSELLKVSRKAYEQELTMQAERAGCTGQGRLGNNPALTELSDRAKTDAESIVNTYNYDLAAAITQIKKDAPRANRNTYVKRLASWEKKRNTWKAEQVAQWTEGVARVKAQQDFYKFNNLDGVAYLLPKEAAEEICQGWINRGRVPLREMLNNPPPYHQNCPHYVVTEPEQIEQGECDQIWLGA